MKRLPIVFLAFVCQGWFNALPATVVGLILAGTYSHGKVTFANNAIQFSNVDQFLGTKHEFEAMTIGNVSLYANGSSPEDISNSPYTGNIIETGLHEREHTFQAEMLGMYYLPVYAALGGPSSSNPMELFADHVARTRK